MAKHFNSSNRAFCCSLGSLSNDDLEAVDNVWLKINLYLICYSQNKLDQFGVSSASKATIVPAEDVNLTFQKINTNF